MSGGGRGAGTGGSGGPTSTSSMGTNGSPGNSIVGSANRSPSAGHNESPQGTVRWASGRGVEEEEDGGSGSSFGLGGHRYSSESRSCGSVLEFSFGTTGTDSSGSPLVS
ncbi:hypothetical protein M1146_03490 [Patescibacteria group bacterium]|nr:hypothetical protein [Patescibacteria group bacterium]